MPHAVLARTLSERLASRGWRLTPQRAAIAAALDDSRGHVSAEQVSAAVRDRGVRVSLATVYNTLTALVAMGELREVRAGRGPALFDFNVRPHHHLVCDECGRLVDVDPGVAHGIELPVGQRHGFELRAVDVVFRGRCRACAAGR
jgi:Fur family transcriptional regulator, stress-responsive regulator